MSVEHARQWRRALAGIATVATAGVLVAGLSVANGAWAASGNGAPQLTNVNAPAAPAGCSDAQLRERARQIQLLDAEKANESRVIATITDGSAPDKLSSIRDRARIVLGRIQALDARCGGGDAGGNGGGNGANNAGGNGGGNASGNAGGNAGGAAQGGNRTLKALRVSCANVDFTGVDAAKAGRAREELQRNLDQINGRLAREFPRFSARVAREANPDAARNEFTTLANQLANTLEARRVAILDRAGAGLSARFARTCSAA